MDGLRKAMCRWSAMWIALAAWQPAAGWALAGTYEAPLDVRKDGDVKFVATPKLTAGYDGSVKISFELSAASDVEVAALGENGRVVRHLAAGLLGKNAPAPLKQNSLRQELVWDRKDDLGAAVSGNAFQVRVRAGSTPRLDRVVGFDGNTLDDQVVGLCVGPRSEVYVLQTLSRQNRCSLRVFDKDGRYQRTLIPYSAATPPERTKSIGQLEVEGQRIPIVFDGLGGNLAPLMAGMKHQRMVFSPKGYLVMASAVGSIMNHRPPRYLLAVHPDGGAPADAGFVGPQIRGLSEGGLGFMGGQGEANHLWFTHMATSPDGEWIYLTESVHRRAFPPNQCVYRAKWNARTGGPPRLVKESKDFVPDDLGKPFLGTLGEGGSDDAHFNDPQGLDVDARGNLYVCDWGNNRVMVFSSEGKLLVQWPVDQPEQIAVHPKSGAVYVLSRGRRDNPRREAPVLRTFSALGAGAPKELARLQAAGLTLMALDPYASPARLWVAVSKGEKSNLRPITDRGDSLDIGTAVDHTDGGSSPSFVVGDPDRDRVIYRDGGTWTIDLTTGKKTELIKDDERTDLATDAEGNLYVLGRWESNAIFRYDPTGKPLPFSGTGSYKMNTGPLVSTSSMGQCVALNGDIYVFRSNQWVDGVGNRLDQFGPDGRPKRRNLVDGLRAGDCGIGVDAAGNVYLGINAKPKDRPLPGAFLGKVPATAWEYWQFNKQGPREIPWCYPYQNPYLNQMGAVFKFGPSGGACYGFARPYAVGKDEPKPDPPAPRLASISNAPAGSATFWSGYLRKEGRVTGALWRYAGIGPVPGDFGWGDPGCICYSSRLAVDPYGRVFAPNVFRFCVEMLDTNGNHIARIGTYGNSDDGLPGANRTGPEIAFAWPRYVSAAGDKVFVSDSSNRRITVVRFEWQAEATVAP